MVEIESELTNKKYNLIEVSPTVFNLIVSNDTTSEDSIELKQKIANLLEVIKVNEDLLPKLDDKTPAETQIKLDKAELDKCARRLAVITRIKPSTIYEVLRTFVKECEDKSDKEILGLGSDVDLLYVAIQEEINKNATRYESAIKNFRQKQKRNN